MNYFIEGLQGSGKSTAVRMLTEKHSGLTPVTEGEHSPVELAWCAYVNEKQYRDILDRYAAIRSQIEEKTFAEGDMRVVCYTKIQTDVEGFYKDLEQYEIYNGRTAFDRFKNIVLGRYNACTADNMVFECSLFQNTVEDMILYRQFSDEQIIDFYRSVRDALSGMEYKIVYIEAENVADNINTIRRERSDENGNELWFPMMMEYLRSCPYARSHDLTGFDGLVQHLEHRQRLELRICRELFADKTVILRSKKYTDIDI